MRGVNNFGIRYRGGNDFILTERQVLRLIQPRPHDSVTNALWPKLVDSCSEPAEKPFEQVQQQPLRTMAVSAR